MGIRYTNFESIIQDNSADESQRDILYYDGVNPEVGKDSSTTILKLKSIISHKEPMDLIENKDVPRKHISKKIRNSPKKKWS